MIQCKHDGRIDFKTAHVLGYCTGGHDCMIDNICDIEIIIDKSEFKLVCFQLLKDVLNLMQKRSK